MPAKSRLASRIAELRKERKLTQPELANETGLSYVSIRNYENSIREPNSRAMVILERFFGVSGAYLRGETDQRQPIQYSWHNAEHMAIITDGLPAQLASLAELLATRPAFEQKMTFDILVELRHVLSSATLTDAERQATLSLLQAFIGMVTLDNTAPPTEVEDGIKKYRQLDQRGQAAVLDSLIHTIHREYDYLHEAANSWEDNTVSSATQNAKSLEPGRVVASVNQTKPTRIGRPKSPLEPARKNKGYPKKAQ